MRGDAEDAAELGKWLNALQVFRPIKVFRKQNLLATRLIVTEAVEGHL